MPVVNMRHVRTRGQKKLYQKIARARICSFCVDFCKGQAPTYHPLPIIREGKWWAVTNNMIPQQNAKLHLLVVLKQHRIFPSLPSEAWSEFGEHLNWVIKKYKLPGGGFYSRFGNSDYTGASVSHLHFNIIFGGAKSGEPLRIKVGYTKASP